ncbi:hypothetical protein RND81_10G080300 [Saponaria officinalis]
MKYYVNVKENIHIQGKVAESKYNNKRELKVQKTIVIEEQDNETNANYTKGNEETTKQNSGAMVKQEAHPTEDKAKQKSQKQELDGGEEKENTNTRQIKRKREDTTHKQ